MKSLVTLTQGTPQSEALQELAEGFWPNLASADERKQAELLILLDATESVPATGEAAAEFALALAGTWEFARDSDGELRPHTLKYGNREGTRILNRLASTRNAVPSIVQAVDAIESRETEGTDDDRRQWARTLLLSVLSKTQPRSENDVRVLAEALSSDEQSLREAAAKALGNTTADWISSAAGVGAGPGQSPAPEEERFQIKGGNVRFEYDRFLLLRHDGKIIALRAEPDPRYGWDGITYRWYRLTDGTDQFFKPSPAGGESSPNPNVETGRGETREGDVGRGSGAIEAGPLAIKWSKSGPRSGWLYLDEIKEPVEIYAEQFDRIEDFSGKLDEEKWRRIP